VNVFNKNGKKIKITENSYAGGGEGDIYIVGDLAIKVFHKNTISESKISELNKINNTNVISPIEAIYCSQGTCIGYSMKFIKDAEPLSKMITTRFQNENGIELSDLLKILTSLRKSFSDIHKAGCLVVDGNEMNFLVDVNKMEAILIDTDSYKSPSFNPTAISPSTTDPLANKHFTEGSDWYIYAILCTLLLIGVHPFKGRHPKYIKRDITKRMVDGASLFDANVTLPKMARKISYIPDNLRVWLEDTLSNKTRVAPPEVLGNVVNLENQAIIRRIIGNKEFELYSDRVVWGDEATTINTGKKEILEIDGRPVIFKISDDSLMYYDMSSKTAKNSNIKAQRIIVSDNYLFTIYNDIVSRVAAISISGGLILGTDMNIQVMPYATTVFNNVIIQNVLGKILIGVIENGLLSFEDYGLSNIANAVSDGNKLVVWSSCLGIITKYTIDTTTQSKLTEIVDDINI